MVACFSGSRYVVTVEHLADAQRLAREKDAALPREP